MLDFIVDTHLSIFRPVSRINWCENKSIFLSLLNWQAKGGWVPRVIGDPDFFPNSQEVKSLRTWTWTSIVLGAHYKHRDASMKIVYMAEVEVFREKHSIVSSKGMGSAAPGVGGTRFGQPTASSPESWYAHRSAWTVHVCVRDDLLRLPHLL